MRFIVMLFALALAACSSYSWLPGATDAEVAKLNTDLAELQQDLATAGLGSAQVEQLISDVSTADWLGAVIDVATVLPGLVNATPEIAQDVRTIAKDLEALVSSSEAKASLKRTQSQATRFIAQRRASAAAMRNAAPAQK